MGKAKTCDRCKNFFTLDELNEEKELFRIKKVNMTKTENRYEKGLDLCPKCQRSLKEWWNQSY